MNPVKLSKLLSFVLRHRPEAMGLTLEPQGWCNIDALVEALQNDGHNITAHSIKVVVHTDDKGRYAISECGEKIRAVQGHSTPIDSVMFEQVDPPEFLYHGTATRFMTSIYQQGIIAKGRHHVHLSDNIETAKDVGSRHGKPVVLRIHAQRMAENGAIFHRSENGVWLIPSVPTGYYDLDESGYKPQDFFVVM